MTPCEAEAIIAAANEENSELFKALRVTEADLTAAQAENADLRAEVEMLRRGGRTLGEIIDRQSRELIELTGSHDVIGEDGDGDWAVVWDRLHEMKDWGGKANVVINSRTGEPSLYDDGGHVCLPCRNGDHSQHQPTLADACVGCACEVMRWRWCRSPGTNSSRWLVRSWRCWICTVTTGKGSAPKTLPDSHAKPSAR